MASYIHTWHTIANKYKHEIRVRTQQCIQMSEKEWLSQDLGNGLAYTTVNVLLDIEFIICMLLKMVVDP